MVQQNGGLERLKEREFKEEQERNLQYRFKSFQFLAQSFVPQENNLYIYESSSCSSLPFNQLFRSPIIEVLPYSLYKLIVQVIYSVSVNRYCQDICGYCQRHMLCKLANPLTKRTLLVIGQIYDGFSTSRNKSSSLVFKPCKSVQETNEEVLFIKARQIARQIHIYRGLMLKLDSGLTEAVSIENYETQIFRFDFMHIQVYLCRVYFLTTLDIYKDYFKDRQR